MKSVLIFQPDIRAYRCGFFCSLNSQIGGRLTIAHFGHCECQDCGFSEIHIHREEGSVLRRIWRLMNLCKRHDVVVAMFDLHYWDVIIATLLTRKGRKCIYWGHGFGRSEIGRRLRKVLAWHADAIILYGKRGADELANAGVAREKLFVAQNSMVVEGHYNTAPIEKEYFLFVGRVQERKRLDILIDAYESYAELSESHAFGLRIVGDGEDAGLRRKCDLLADRGFQVEWIRGTTDPLTLRSLFTKAVAYVSPGHVGLGVIHAFSFGVPVITCNVDGHAPEYENVVDEENGLIVEFNHAALSDALFRLGSNADFARKLGSGAFETYMENANPRQMVTGFLGAIGFSRAFSSDLDG